LEGKLSSNHDLQELLVSGRVTILQNTMTFFGVWQRIHSLKESGGVFLEKNHITHRVTEKLSLLLDETPSRQLERMKTEVCFLPVLYLPPILNILSIIKYTTFGSMA